jgi:hypothetical protein
MSIWFQTSFTYTSNKVLEFIVTNTTKDEPLNYTNLPEACVPTA